MDPLEHVREGNLAAAIEAVKERVRAEPDDVSHRAQLFKLLCVDGDWDRASTQLAVASEMDSAAAMMARLYRDAPKWELFRARVFAGAATPVVLGEVEEWMAHLLEALRQTGAGETGRGTALRDKAFDAAPTTPGTIDGHPFEWIADADPRIGPMLETIVNGQYYWVPTCRIALVKLEPPADLTDAVWMQAQFVWSNGGEAAGLIPTRYPGSEQSDSAVIKLSKQTEWLDQTENTYFGMGQRLLATDQGEYPLMDIREIQLNLSSEQAAAVD